MKNEPWRGDPSARCLHLEKKISNQKAEIREENRRRTHYRDECERLAAERDALKAALDSATTLHLNILAQSQAARERVEAERAALREALEPFNRISILGEVMQGLLIRVGLSVNDIKRARAALAPTKPYTIADSNRDQSERLHWMNKCEDAGRDIGGWEEMRDAERAKEKSE